MTRKRLANINAIAITKEELWQLARDAEAFQRDHPNNKGVLIVRVGWIAARMKKKKGERHRGFAIWCRMHALMLLLQEDDVSGWALPIMPDGSRLVNDALFSAAAVQPLIERDGQWAFERQSFLDKVLELAESEASA